MYVPQYDPNVAYTSNYPVSFGVGYPIGLWDDNDFNWNGGFVVMGGGWYGGWHHPSAWDRNPPAWNRHPAGWSAAPRAWTRSSELGAPRMGATVVAHLNLDRGRPGAPGRLSPGPARNAPAPEQSRNAFNSVQSRNEVQRSVQQARPAPAPPAPRAMPARVAPERAAPPQAAPHYAPQPVQRSAPSNAFGGGSGGQARAQSSRGRSSGHR
jgi:hypothetical protein